MSNLIPKNYLNTQAFFHNKNLTNAKISQKNHKTIYAITGLVIVFSLIGISYRKKIIFKIRSLLIIQLSERYCSLE